MSAFYTKLKRRRSTEERPSAVREMDPIGEHVRGRFDFDVRGKRYSIQIANDLEMRKKAHRFMRWIYGEKGWGRPHRSGMLYSLYELLPDAVTLTVWHESNLVATLTVVVDSPLGLPDDANYKDALDHQRVSGRRLTQIISLGVRNDMRHNALLIVKLFNFAYFVARGIKGATDFVITVLPHHTAFYERKMLFQRIGEPRWQKKTGVTVELLKLNFEDAERETLREHGPEELRPARSKPTYYREFNTASEKPETVAELRAAILPIDVRCLNYFLAKKPEILAKASPEQRAYIEDYVRYMSSAVSRLSVMFGKREALHSFGYDMPTVSENFERTFNLLRWQNDSLAM